MNTNKMTNRIAETSPLIYARVARLSAPQVIKTNSRFVILFIFIHKGGDLIIVNEKLDLKKSNNLLVY